MVAPQGDGSLTPEQLAVQTQNYQLDVSFAGSPADVETNGPTILEPIDYSLVPKDELLDGFTFTYGVGGPPNALVFGYNPTYLPSGEVPTRIEDFFDLAGFPGKRGILEFLDTDIIALALLASGVAPEDLVPFDYPRAFAELDKIKSEIVWAQSGTQARQLLDAGETPLQLTFASRIKESVDSGQPAAVAWDGFSVFFDTWVIPKGDPKADAAMKLIAYISSSEANGKMSDCVAVGVSNRLAKANPAMTPFLSTSHFDQRHVVLSAPEYLSWITTHSQEIHDRFEAWKTQ